MNKIGSEERHTFRAVFGKYGYKRYHDKLRGELYSPTMVVKQVEIIDDPEKPRSVTDHLWLNLTKSFTSLGLLHSGDKIQFDGRVVEYTQGYINKDKKDYKLSYPTKVELIENREVIPLPEDHQVLIGMIMNLNYNFYMKTKRPFVPYFMDAFEEWQNNQDNPLSIECHQGNEWENSEKYERLNYHAEEKAWQDAKMAQQEAKKKNMAEGIEFLKKHPEWIDELIVIGKRKEQEVGVKENHPSAKHCFISSSSLENFVNTKQLDLPPKQIRKLITKIKYALAFDWFKEKFQGEKSEDMDNPFSKLANFYNQK